MHTKSPFWYTTTTVEIQKRDSWEQLSLNVDSLCKPELWGHIGYVTGINTN
jgi:hypothetical protein